jgi:hypothetical protein
MTSTKRKKPVLVWLLLAGYAFIVSLFMAFIGTAGGIQAARIERGSTQVAGRVQSLLEQYTLGVQELEAGNYGLARQRFEYVLANDPAFPGAADKLAEAMQILSVTATWTPVPATVTPTPTRDPRPVEEMFTNVKNLFISGEWNSVIEAIVALRQADPLSHVTEVDGILYRSLRNRGVLKITNDGNLEGGIYDLSLAEQFGPLDAEAINYRDLARYYMMGSGFWEVYPEQAVYYFGLVTSALPSLRDGSGWTAAARYQAALVQWGDQFAKNSDWCTAQEKYELALSYGGDTNLQETIRQAAYNCSPPTETPEPITETPMPSLSPTVLPTEILTPTPLQTQPVTPTQTPQPTMGETIEPSPTSTPTQTTIPTVTPAPTLPSTATVPPLPTDTETPLPTQPEELTITPTVQSDIASVIP